MKKFMFLAAAAVATLASCTSEEELVVNNAANETESAITFSAYNPSQSRATQETLATTRAKGFGVFAFSHMQEPIDKYTKTNYVPNFMYNQKVAGTGTDDWTYSPIKYWPNNPGAMVSFYAYAPYCPEFSTDQNTYTQETNEYLNEIKPIEGKNLRLMLGYDYNGPGIEYTRPADPTKGTDLMWGEYIAGKGQAVNAGTGTAGTGTASPMDIAAVNVTKQSTNDAIFFQFHHALSRLHFNVQVWSDVNPGATADDYHNPDGSANQGLAPGTTIKIKKVELVGNFPTKGTLRLFDGSWNVEKGDYDNIVFEAGKGQFATAIENGLTLEDAKAEIELLAGTLCPTPDETGTETNNFVMAIPAPGYTINQTVGSGVKGKTTFYIQITYDVITEDGTNPKNNSVVTNVVKSTDLNALAGPDAAAGIYTLEAGKAYNFHLNIGMTSVKFAADVTPWDVLNPEVVLPKND